MGLVMIWEPGGGVRILVAGSRARMANLGDPCHVTVPSVVNIPANPKLV